MKVILSNDQLKRISTDIFDTLFNDLEMVDTYSRVPNFDVIEPSVRFITPYAFIRPNNDVIMIVQGNESSTKLYVRREVIREMRPFLPILEYENKVSLRLIGNYIKDKFNVDFDDVKINDMLINHVEDFLNDSEQYL